MEFLEQGLEPRKPTPMTTSLNKGCRDGFRAGGKLSLRLGWTCRNITLNWRTGVYNLHTVLVDCMQVYLINPIFHFYMYFLCDFILQ